MYKATTVATNWAVLGIFYFFLGLYVPGKYLSVSLLSVGACKHYLIGDRVGDDVLLHA